MKDFVATSELFSIAILVVLLAKWWGSASYYAELRRRNQERVVPMKVRTGREHNA